MALVRCPDCGREVSDMAPACPQCARPLGGPASSPIAMQVAQDPAGQERAFFNDALVQVTNRRVVFSYSGVTYAMANITSVRMFTQPAQIGCAVMLALAGFVGGAIIIVNDNPVGWVGVLAGAAFGLFAYGKRQAKHWVLIGTAGQEVQAAWSFNAAWTRGVVDAINAAMVSRYS